MKTRPTRKKRIPSHVLMNILYRAPLLAHIIPDSACLKLIYFCSFWKKLDLKNPKTFTAKLQWLKLYNRKPEYTKMVDKHEVKKYVAGKIGKEYVIPTLGKWKRFDEIDFEKLPNQFVLKCTHDSGSLVICSDKRRFDRRAAQKKLERCLRKNYFYMGREWPYKHVRPRIIAEPYLVDESGYELKDYKFFCFDAQAKVMYMAADRCKEGEDTKFDFFDMEFRHLPIKNGHENANTEIFCREPLPKMKELAEKLSSGMPHVRIDFYYAGGKIYFGEMTFFHLSGFVPLEPKEWDAKLGEWLHLPPPQTF